jgi:hypothetical protein
MTTYSIFGYNFVVVPKFDFMIKLESGTSYFLHDRYMKYFALFCLFCGVSMLWRIIYKLKPLTNKLLAYFTKPTVRKGNFVVILGFGDTHASIKLTRYFAGLGYNILALNNKKILTSRRVHNLNKVEHLDTLPSRLEEHTYEELFGLNLDFLTGKNIEFVFDCSIFRVIMDVPEEKNDKNAIFFRNDIQATLNDYYTILDMLKSYFLNAKIFLMEYEDKEDDVNHKLVFDLKYSMISNYATIYKEKIYYLKKVKLYNILKPHLFKESNINKIFKYSELKEVEYSFI